MYANQQTKRFHCALGIEGTYSVRGGIPLAQRGSLLILGKRHEIVHHGRAYAYDCSLLFPAADKWQAPETHMKSACLRTAAALALLCCVNVSAAPYPTEEQFRTAIGAVAGLLKPEGLEFEMLDGGKEGLTRPLLAAGLNLTSGVCLIFYNTRPEDGLTQFFSTVRQEDMPVMLSAMAVHEITHCIEQREAYIRKRFDRVLPPDFKHADVTIQGYLSVVKSGALVTWGEALADIASVLYLKQTVPVQWLGFANSIAALRHNTARKWPEHDTSAWLYRIIAADVDQAANQSLFDAAFLLRRQYNPAK